MDVPLTPEQRAAVAERLADAERQRRELEMLWAEAEHRRAEEARTMPPVSPEVRLEVARRLSEHPLRGCEVCERRAFSGDHEPYVIDSIVEQAALWRCSVCGTWWEEMPHEVHVLTADEARRLWGDRLDGADA